MFLSILQAIWRAGGATAAGVLLSTALATPWGLVATPVLMGISKAIKQYYTNGGQPAPAWLGWLPF